MLSSFQGPYSMAETIQTSLRFDPELHEQLRYAVIRRKNKSLQDAVFEAVRMWLDKGEPAAATEAPPAELAGATKEELAWCGKLVSLLREGEPAAVDLVQHALNRQARQMRDRRKQAGA
jgi:hypothetical protein